MSAGVTGPPGGVPSGWATAGPPPPRRGPAAWVVVLLTLAGVAVAVLLFGSGVAVGVWAAGIGGTTSSAGPVPAVPAPDLAPPTGPAEPVPEVGPSTGSPPPPAGADAFDDCLVGTWRSTEHTESYETEQGPASVTELERTIAFEADGTETITYDASAATITTSVGALPAVFEGTVVYQAATSGSTMSFSLVSAEGTVTIVGPDGEVLEERPLEPGAGDVTYTCDETTFVQEAPGFRSAYERLG